MEENTAALRSEMQARLCIWRERWRGRLLAVIAVEADRQKSGHGKNYRIWWPQTVASNAGLSQAFALRSPLTGRDGRVDKWPSGGRVTLQWRITI